MTPARPASSPTVRGRRPGRVRRALLVVAAVFVTVVAQALPAQAHNSLISTDPADGASLEAAPTQITLTFDAEVLALGTVLDVQGPGGQAADGDAVIADNVVTQPLHADLPAGEYTVSWRVTSADGHPIEGRFTFTAAEAAPTAVPVDPTPETTAPESPAPAEPTSAAEPTSSTTPTAQPTDTESSGGSGVAPQLGVLAVIAAVVVVLVVRDRRKVARNHQTRD